MSFMSEMKICKHYYDDTRHGPVMVDIHPTLACQNRCYFCISANPHITGMEHENFSRNKKIDWSDLQEAIIDMKSMGVKSVQLTGGGEPTLYPQFGELLEKLMPMRVGLITNGVILGEYAREVVSHCDWVRISLDAVGGEMYRQIKGVDNYHMVVDSIEKLCSTRRGQRDPKIGVAYILTNESIRGMSDVVMEMSKHDIDYIQFRDVVERGRTFNTEFKTKIVRGLERAREVVNHKQIIYTSHQGDERPDGGVEQIPICDATDYTAALGADSEVYPCCSLEYQDFASYGNIKQRRFSEIWNTRPRVNITESLCWNCRMKRVNKTLQTLASIECGEFI